MCYRFVLVCRNPGMRLCIARWPDCLTCDARTISDERKSKVRPQAHTQTAACADRTDQQPKQQRQQQRQRCQAAVAQLTATMPSSLLCVSRWPCMASCCSELQERQAADDAATAEMEKLTAECRLMKRDPSHQPSEAMKRSDAYQQWRVYEDHSKER